MPTEDFRGLDLHEAARLDREDPLRLYRGRFHLPRDLSGTPLIYLTGNSLGLQPRAAEERVATRMSEWQSKGVAAWHDADWMDQHQALAFRSAGIVGARPHEVAVGGTLTTNLHHLMATFFRPSAGRTRVLMEAGPFPSDRYAVASQLAWHGLDPATHLLTAPSEGLAAMLEREGSSVALVLAGGINYYTGELVDMPELAEIARREGCVMGLDLAHAAGNVPLELHDWGVDFAAWCGYKYLNGGPGAPAGLFVHDRHLGKVRPALTGWWGHDPDTRFEMPDSFEPAPGAEAWLISTPSVLSLAPLEAALAMFAEVGMEALHGKSRLLTGFLQALLADRLHERVRILTPARRGAQLSLSVDGGRETFDRLSASGVTCDWREPDVIRAAPAPLYNTFTEMLAFVERLEAALPD